MSNPFYQSVMGNVMPQQPVMQTPQKPQNPMQMMQMVMQAMQNPAGFVKQMFPDIPDSIQNDPNQIFQYLNQTRGQVSQQQINQAQQAMGQRMR